MMRLKSLSAAMLAAGAIAGGAVGGLAGMHLPAAAAPQTAAAAQVPPAPVAGTAMPDFRAIVKQAGPAVVGITVQGTQRTADRQAPQLPPGLENSPFAPFFRGMPDGGPAQPLRGMGSGFIIGADGLILTNAHVVQGADTVTVKLSDRREYAAKVLGSDPVTDVAVLRIDAKNLPTVRLGDPGRLEVGDPVLAIGAPYGFEQSATQGIVSAKGRSLPGDAVVPFIQTDAAVNPGNSGGPLFDGSGAVVGINSQIYSRTGGFQGLSFSIPIDVALKIKDQIVATGSARHARLGVTVQDMNQALAESFGLPRPDGALIAQVAPDSAAAAAGLKSGDVVTEVNGQAIVRSGELSSRIGLAAPGDTVKLKVWRQGASRDVEAKLGTAQPERQQLAAGGDAATGGQLGLAVRPLSAEEKRRAEVEQGLLVEQVGGPAARAGVERGDVLLAINGKPVQSIEQVKSALQGKPKSVALLIQRGNDRIFVPVNLG